jgi:rhodanese-related sulfurtransferase
MNTISVADLKAKIDAGEKLNLLDVREPHEHAAFNIGGQLVPLGLVQALMLDEIEHLKDETIYVYCRSGNRSGQACMMMEPYGFKNVVNVVGGMLAWQGGRSFPPHFAPLLAPFPIAKRPSWRVGKGREAPLKMRASSNPG